MAVSSMHTFVLGLCLSSAVFGARPLPSKTEDPSLWKPVRSLITLSVLTPEQQAQVEAAAKKAAETKIPAPTSCQLKVPSFDFGTKDKGSIERLHDVKEGTQTKLTVNGDSIPVDAFSHLVVSLGEAEQKVAIEFTAQGDNAEVETYFIRGANTNVQVSIMPNEDQLCLNMLTGEDAKIKEEEPMPQGELVATFGRKPDEVVDAPVGTAAAETVEGLEGASQGVLEAKIEGAIGHMNKVEGKVEGAIVGHVGGVSGGIEDQASVERGNSYGIHPHFADLNVHDVAKAAVEFHAHDPSVLQFHEAHDHAVIQAAATGGSVITLQNDDPAKPVVYHTVEVV